MYDFPIIDIRPGTPADAELCQQMTRQHRNAFPFVTLPSLRECAERGGLFIAVIEGIPAGFVSFRACRDGWQTIYELCVLPEWEGLGVGRALLYAVPCPIRLKCPVDLKANGFYSNAGMMLERVETERHGKTLSRPLNIWHMRVLTIHCQGNNRKVPAWANRAGMAYGTRHDNTPRAWPYMLDINWKKVVWPEYLTKVRLLRPVMAMAQDYEHPDQRERMLAQVADLRALGVLRIGVIPKFGGAVADIPPDCIVAVSVPSSYAGFVPEMSELAERKIHLLGGNPQAQADLITRLGGAVISTDYNVHERNAQNGMIFDYGRWVIRSALGTQTEDYDHVVPHSGANIRKHLQGAASMKQGLLL